MFRTALPWFRVRLRQRMALQGTPVTLRWVEWDVAASTDPTTGARIGDSTAKQEIIRAFVHFPDIGRSEYRVFQEIERGDCIVDMPPDTVIEGREQLEFIIHGLSWVQKAVGEQLAQTWEIQRGHALYRSVLLRKKT